MFDVIKSVLDGKRYELTDILKKIDYYWIAGKITDAQKDQLVSMAQEHANVNHSITSEEVLKKLAEQEIAMQEMKVSITTLQKAVATLQGGGSDNPEIETDETTSGYPDFESGKWYYTGDKVTFDGARYICIAPEGTVCVWSPADYPAYWQAE